MNALVNLHYMTYLARSDVIIIFGSFTFKKLLTGEKQNLRFYKMTVLQSPSDISKLETTSENKNCAK